MTASLLSYTAAANARSVTEVSSLNIFADRALTLPLSQLASDYTRESHISVNIAFSPNSAQQQAFESGEAADILISAHPETIDKLTQNGLLLKNSLTPLVTSRLVLVTTTPTKKPTHQAIQLSTFQRIRKEPEFLLAIASKHSSADGYAADQVIQFLKQQIFLADAVVVLENTQDVSDFLNIGGGYGIIFESDAIQNNALHILGEIPNHWYKPPTFAALFASSGNISEAQKFFAYISQPEKLRIFGKNGLYPVLKPEGAKPAR